jgi:hypothetical protein
LAGHVVGPPGIEVQLAPVAFAIDVAVAVANPLAVDPVCVGVGRVGVVSGNPDILVAVVAVIAGVPGPIGVLMGWRRNALDGTRWRTDTDDDLRLGYACGEKEDASGNGKEMLHGFDLLYRADYRTVIPSGKLAPGDRRFAFYFAKSLMI